MIWYITVLIYLHLYEYMCVCADVYLMVCQVPGIYNNNELIITEHLTKCQPLWFKNPKVGLDQGRFYWLLLSSLFDSKETKAEIK